MVMVNEGVCRVCSTYQWVEQMLPGVRGRSENAASESPSACPAAGGQAPRMSVRLAAALLAFASVTAGSAWADAQQAPATPTSVTVTRADGELTASWPTVAGATSYHVTYSSDGGGSWSLAALNHPDDSITIAVDNALTYVVGVRARNEHGDSGWRNSPAAGPYTPAPPQTPATPASVTVTRADGELTASWPAVAGATSYHVTYSSDGGGSWSLAALNHPDSSITIAVDNALTYVVGVRARNEHGDSGWRNSPAAGPYTPAPPQTPATPASVTVTRADGELTASWPAVAGATSYHVTYSSDGGGSWSLAALNHPDSSITIAVDNALTYVVGVRARNEHGDSGWRNSPAAGPYTPAPPQTPATPASVTVTRADGELTASWPAVAGATSYHVTYSSDGGGSWSLAAQNHPDSSITIAVDNALTYVVGVRARNEHGDSGWRNSPAAGPYTPPTEDPEPEVSATLTIDDASADEGDALSFTVTLDNAVPGGFAVTPTFTDGVTVPGEDYSHLTATQGSDYRASAPTLDFAGTAGEAVTFTVPTIEDQKTEYPKVFTVGLSVSGTSHRVTATDTATGIIYDDDAAAASGGAAASSNQIKDNGSTITIYSPPDPEFRRMEYECTIPKRVTETTNASLRFKHLQIACGARPGSIRTGAVAEFWSSGSATATKGSSGDWDYDFFHDKLKFYPAEKSTKRLGFRVNDDELGEGPEYFQFKLKWTTKVGLGWLGIWVTLNESVHTVTIWIDDDDEYNLSVEPASVTEAGGAKTVTVTAAVADDAVLAEARTLSIQVGKSDDLAVEGTDYQNVGNFDVTIPKGGSKGTGTFTLTPVVDAHLEPNERITVAGSGKSDINGKVLRPRVNSTALWLYDSSVVALSASPSVNEGGGAQTVTVTATSTGTAQRATPVTVSVGKSGDAAVEGTDYQAVSDFTVTIPSGSKTGTGTFSITPINDTAVEDDETITLSGTIPGGTVTDGSLTLLDNDVTLALSPASTGEEAGAKTVTVTARAKTARTAARALTVSVGKVGDSAEAGTD